MGVLHYHDMGPKLCTGWHLVHFRVVTSVSNLNQTSCRPDYDKVGDKNDKETCSSDHSTLSTVFDKSERSLGSDYSAACLYRINALTFQVAFYNAVVECVKSQWFA